VPTGTSDTVLSDANSVARAEVEGKVGAAIDRVGDSSGMSSSGGSRASMCREGPLYVAPGVDAAGLDGIELSCALNEGGVAGGRKDWEERGGAERPAAVT
jgi:hypothetical protein